MFNQTKEQYNFVFYLRLIPYLNRQHLVS
ncbi:hypothetical protein AAKU67_004471, partial [Oxalobacteraceae bacterium GrIS 2.11]